MSIRAVYDIWCDACSCWDPDLTTENSSHRFIRKIAKRKGWIVSRYRGRTYDFCPQCAKEGLHNPAHKGRR